MTTWRSACRSRRGRGPWPPRSSTPAPSPVETGAPVGIDQIQIAGPFNGAVPDHTPSRERILTCNPGGGDDEACARQVIIALARRAYRRPVSERDVEPLLDVYRQGRGESDFEAGIGLALEAILSSPQFLIRVEQQPAGAAPGTAYRVSDLELASRLSFFLWRSIPDDALLEAAASGMLADPAELDRQVRRMLADRRATRFTNDFVDQWLQVRNLQAHLPDRRQFRGFDRTLRDAMVQETQLFFESQVRGDRPIDELLRADYTYLNERLARHYGIEDIFGSHLRRVTLTDPRRFGLLGQGSLLTVTSYPNRTSVVLRGKWILENLLGSPPPPPPPNVPVLEENKPGVAPASLRERMESSTAATRSAPPATTGSIRSGLLSSTMMRWANGVRPTTGRTSMRQSCCPDRPSTVRRRSGRRCWPRATKRSCGPWPKSC